MLAIDDDTSFLYTEILNYKQTTKFERYKTNTTKLLSVHSNR